MLLGRERECNQIDRLIEGARARTSAALVIRGDPGIGKSALLAYAVGRAGTMRILRAVGVRSESELPFAALHELLRPALEHIGGLPEPQCAALRGALALGPAAFADRLAVQAGTLALLAEAAEASSLLCVIDDAHWLDPASAEAVLFCARRLQAEGILMLMAARDQERQRFEAPEIAELVLQGLDDTASSELIKQGGMAIAPSVVEQLIRMTQGNPLALIELPAELNRDQRTGREALGEHLPVGKGIRRAFRGRVQALSPATQTALVVAAASDTLDLRTIGAALTELGARLSDLEEAERAGLVAMVDGNLTFHHPLVRSAIYRTADATLRRDAHRALANLRRGNVGSRAWHLSAAATGPDEEAASALFEAGDDASARGAPAVAGWHYARSAAFSLADEVRAQRLLTAGRAYWLAGHSEQALQHLDTALASTADARTRADVQLLRGHALTWTSNVIDAQRLLVAEAERIAPIDRDRAAVLMATAVMGCGMSGQIARGVETARRAVRLAGNGPAHLFANVLLAINSVVAGEPQSRDFLIRSQQTLETATTPEALQLSAVIAHVLMFIEEYDAAQTMLDRIVAAREHGVLDAHPLAARADVEFRVGRWVAAHADAAESVDLARETGQRSVLPFSLVTLARIEAATGREADCRAHVAETMQLLVPLGTDSALSYALSVLGLLEIGYGRFEQVIEPLTRVAAHTEFGHPNALQWAPDLIEAFVRTGRRSAAEETLADLERAADRVGGTWSSAAAARCRGLLAADTEFESEFTAALELHRRTPTPFSRARTELCYGQRLRRAGRRIDAREHLRAALSAFEALGAEPWAKQARAELRSTGERLRKREESTTAKLTAQELQIAVLVAEGGTNREVGARLMLSPRTIEFHLRNVYAKLSVRSRTELATRLAGKGANKILA